MCRTSIKTQLINNLNKIVESNTAPKKWFDEADDYGKRRFMGTLFYIHKDGSKDFTTDLDGNEMKEIIEYCNEHHIQISSVSSGAYHLLQDGLYKIVIQFDW